MTGLPIDVSWSYGPGSSITSSTDIAALTEANVNANVCVDIFLAPDKSAASDTTRSTFEIMVWLGRFGDSTLPLGFEDGALDTRTISGTTL